jgi:hypothetical protein
MQLADLLGFEKKLGMGADATATLRYLKKPDQSTLKDHTTIF